MTMYKPYFALLGLPDWRNSIDNLWFNSLYPGGPERISCTFWGISSYVIVYSVFFVFWQTIRQWLYARMGLAVEKVFFDKLCIHQTNMSLREDGIKAIDVFLMRSSQLVILWEPTYFKRLWFVMLMNLY